MISASISRACYVTCVVCLPARLVCETEMHRPSQVGQRKQAPRRAQWIWRAIGEREWRVNSLGAVAPATAAAAVAQWNLSCHLLCPTARVSLQ